MFYTPTIVKAMKIAYSAHDGEFDMAGAPFIFHVMHSAEQMKDESAIVTALLHDVVHSDKLTEEALLSEGFPVEVVEAVMLLTKNKTDSYFDYIRKVKNDPIARAVKIADLKHNMEISRHYDSFNDRYNKYAIALSILMNGEE